MKIRGLLGLLACSALGLGGPGCGFEPIDLGDTLPSDGSSSTTEGGSATLGSATSETGEACDPAHAEHFLVLAGVSQGVITWSTIVADESTMAVPAILDLEGGVVLGSIALGLGSQLVRHTADGTRVATLPLAGTLTDLATDGSGRIVYLGFLDEGVAYGEVDQSLAPLGPLRALPWQPVGYEGYQAKLAALPDGTNVVAVGEAGTAGRRLSQLDAEGNEVWTSTWPVESEPDQYGDGQVAGVAVLDDGTIGLALTSGDLYDGNLWIEGFHPDGQHAWAATAPGRKTMRVTATADTFVVTSKEQVDGFTADGVDVWSSEASPRGLARPCTDMDLVAATPTGFMRLSPGGAPVAEDVDLLGLELPTEGYDEAGSLVHDVVCTPEGDVIVVADIDVMFYSSGDCGGTGG